MLVFFSKKSSLSMGFQKYLPTFLLKRSHKKNQKFSEKDLNFKKEITKLLGYDINNLEIYREAFSLKSSSRGVDKKNYERLEFLGDSVLGSIISCHLYIIYPDANEGFLTQMKSKIVNRKNLNKLGEELQLTNLIFADSSVTLGENITGNLLEAFVGAIFLDTNYETCKKIVLEKLMPPAEINKLENKIVSYKGLLLEWSQKKKVSVRYETEEEQLPNKQVAFRCYVWLKDEKIANASDSSKKKAEEKAAQRAFYMLNKKENILETQKTIS